MNFLFNDPRTTSVLKSFISSISCSVKLLFLINCFSSFPDYLLIFLLKVFNCFSVNAGNELASFIVNKFTISSILVGISLILSINFSVLNSPGLCNLVAASTSGTCLVKLDAISCNNYV